MAHGRPLAMAMAGPWPWLAHGHVQPLAPCPGTWQGPWMTQPKHVNTQSLGPTPDLGAPGPGTLGP